MKNTVGRPLLMIALALLACGCNKKAEGGSGTAGSGAAGTSTATAAATGIKGKIRGKPYVGKVALLDPDSENGNPTLYLKGSDAKCKGNPSGPLGIPEKGINEASVTAPLKTGVQKFEKDKVEGGLSFWNDKGDLASSISNPTGEVEWITLPTEKTKGLVRVDITQESNDTKIDGSMEVSLCPK